jgi:hypothetical protein
MIDKKLYINSMNKIQIKTWAFLSLATFIIFMLWCVADGTGNNLVIIGIGILVALIIFYGGAGRFEITKRPKSVEIKDSGVVLNQKLFHRTIFIPWQQILTINVYIGASDKIPASLYQDGTLWTIEGSFFQIARPIALQIREDYLKHVGHYPPRGRPGSIVGMTD